MTDQPGPFDPPRSEPPQEPTGDGGFSAPAPPPPPPPPPSSAPPAPAYGAPASSPAFGGPPVAPTAGGYQGGPPPGTAQAHSGYVDIPSLGTVKVATIGQRLVARIIDAVILWVIAAIVMGIGGFGLFAGAATVHVNQTTGAVTTSGGVGFAGFILAIFVLGLIGIGYEVVLIALRGQTLGKQVMGVKVVLQENGQVPGWGPSILRWILPVIGSFVCGIGEIVVYLSVLFDNSGRHQGWHDKVAHDLVISLK